MIFFYLLGKPSVDSSCVAFKTESQKVASLSLSSLPLPLHLFIVLSHHFVRKSNQPTQRDDLGSQPCPSNMRVNGPLDGFRPQFLGLSAEASDIMEQRQIVLTVPFKNSWFMEAVRANELLQLFYAPKFCGQLLDNHSNYLHTYIILPSNMPLELLREREIYRYMCVCVCVCVYLIFSCGMWGLLVLASMQTLSCGLWSCGIQFPNRGSIPVLLHCEHGVLATGPPGKSLIFFFIAFFKSF